VKVAKLGDAKALKGFGQACEPNARASDFHVEPAVEKPVGRGHKGHGDYYNATLMEPEELDFVRHFDPDGSLRELFDVRRKIAAAFETGFGPVVFDS
jgi:hypothetical protein